MPRRPAGHTLEDIITRSPAMRTGNSALTRARRLAGWWSLAGLATAAVLLLALVGVTFWVSRPQAVSAQEILDKAQAAAAGADASGVRSFEMVEENVAWGIIPSQRAQGISGRIRSAQHAWFRAPDHWRYELRFTELPGQGPDPAPRVTVADGQTIWSYEPRGNALQISLGQFGGTGKKGDYGLYGAGSLA